jgi:peptidoglycan/xylan/chitin deacetylase (PgdA/CDA1 family)
MALVFLLVCVCTFFGAKNYLTVKKEEKVREQLGEEYYIEKNDRSVLRRPTIDPRNTFIANYHVKLPILMYHYVEYVRDPNDTMRIKLTIPPYLFEKQLQTLLDNGFTTYQVKDIPAILDEKMPIEASKSAILTFDDGYEDFYTDAWPLLKKYNMKATIYVINDLLNHRGYLTTDELLQIATDESHLVEIGAHTMDHAYLTGMKHDAVLGQIVNSKKGLESLLGIPVETFAYPFGAFDDQAVEITKEASFSAAVSVIPGNVQSKHDLFYLPRIRAGAFTGVKALENIEKDYPPE